MARPDPAANAAPKDSALPSEFDLERTVTAVRTIFKDYKDPMGQPAHWVLFSHGTLLVINSELSDKNGNKVSAEEAGRLATQLLDQNGKVIIGSEYADFIVYEQDKYIPEGGVYAVMYHYPAMMTICFAAPKAIGDKEFRIGRAARASRQKDWETKKIVACSES